jgi:hypothetical protein
MQKGRRPRPNPLHVLRSELQLSQEHPFEIAAIPARFHQSFVRMGARAFQNVRRLMRKNVAEKGWYA